jgi:hypothetical protein
MWRELAKFFAGGAEQTLRLRVEVPVEHPDRVIPTGDVFLQDQSGLGIQVTNLEQVLGSGHNCNAREMILPLLKLTEFAFHDHRKLCALHELQHILARLRLRSPGARNSHFLAKIGGLLFAKENAHHLG